MILSQMNVSKIFRNPFLAFACSAAIFSCSNEISDIRAITDINNKPVQTSYKATYVFSEKGKIQNKLTAEQLDQFQGDEEYVLASGGFVMVFYDSLENEEARLSAVNGKYIEKQKKLIAWDHVSLFNVKGEKLETEELTFEQDSSRIFSDKEITITTANGSIIRGRGLISNESFTRYRILQPTGDLIIEEKQESENEQNQ